MGNLGENHRCNKENAYKCGFFKRKSGAQRIQRYRCKICKKWFSQATFDPTCWQKKRHLNYPCLMMLSSNVSMRRTAIILNINPKTVARKLLFLSQQLQPKLDKQNYSHVTRVQFDELQTIEHTKCKPLSVVMAVSKPDRKKGLHQLFSDLQLKLNKDIEISSDECSYYRPVVNRYFPNAKHNQFKGEKGSISGQGELKKIRRDPLFSINHTFAMCRTNINRLIRRTWCSTKKIDRLIDHLTIYAWVHNSKLTATS